MNGRSFDAAGFSVSSTCAGRLVFLFDLFRASGSLILSARKIRLHENIHKPLSGKSGTTSACTAKASANPAIGATKKLLPRSIYSLYLRKNEPFRDTYTLRRHGAFAHACHSSWSPSSDVDQQITQRPRIARPF